MATLMCTLFLGLNSGALCLPKHPPTLLELHLATGLNWSSCNHDNLNSAKKSGYSQGEEHIPVLRHRSSIVYLSLTESALQHCIEVAIKQRFKALSTIFQP